MSNMTEDPREIKARFLFMVKVTKALVLLTKEELKYKRATKILKTVDECKLQHGSLKLNSIDLVNKLTKK